MYAVLKINQSAATNVSRNREGDIALDERDTFHFAQTFRPVLVSIQ